MLVRNRQGKASSIKHVGRVPEGIFFRNEELKTKCMNAPSMLPLFIPCRDPLVNMDNQSPKSMKGSHAETGMQ